MRSKVFNVKQYCCHLPYKLYHNHLPNKLFKLSHRRGSWSIIKLKCNKYLNKNNKYLHKFSNFNFRTIVSNKKRLFSYYSYCIPKPIHIKKKKFGKISNDFGYAGEDAYFTQIINPSGVPGDSKSIIIGVADGVGSWKPQKATDAAHYAQSLMKSGIQYLSSINNYITDNLSRDLSYRVAYYSSSCVFNNKSDGASTLCIVNIFYDNKNCILNAYNLGDSGFCIYRHKIDQNDYNIDDDCYELIYSSPSQEQGFGVPYQLGSHSTANSIDDGYCLNRFNLKPLDIIIVGSDGLWDNLFNHEISTLICQTMTKYNNNYINEILNKNKKEITFNDYVHNKIVNGDLTHRILKDAYYNSIDRSKTTPWSKAMTDTVDMVYNGGKPDDITCVVVFIH